VDDQVWTPECNGCLPFEDQNEQAMQKLQGMQIHVNGRYYEPTGTPFIWKAQNHESLVVALKENIGAHNPFLLFKLGRRSVGWFFSHTPEKRAELLMSLRNAGESGPGFDLGKHLQLVKSPVGSETPFRHEGKPIHVVGRCPHCGNLPNPHANN